MGLRKSAPFSSLQRRIIFFNLMGLAVLVFGVLYLNQFRSSLIEQRVQAMRMQGEIIAIALTGGATEEDPNAEAAPLDPEAARATIASLGRPLDLRVRLFDTELRLMADSRSPDTGGELPIAVTPLPAPPTGVKDSVLNRAEAAYDTLVQGIPGSRPGFTEVPTTEVATDAEIVQAAAGRVASSIRVNSAGELILSVALPVRRLSVVQGVLVMSTEGGDINRIVQRERVIILQVFVVAAAVSVLLSIILANTIAAPIQRLAEAADPEGERSGRLVNPERVEIPDLTHRIDEIGDLSDSLIRMTSALYTRIEAIESFAADVAHEIKNPLTSLRSAVETLEYAKTDEQRLRLMGIIQKDVNRLDRLVTDISNASRLDAELVRERMDHVDLVEIVTTMTSITATQGQERGIGVVTRMPGNALVVAGLEVRLAQVFTNLLDNALSFSPEGGTITVEGRMLPNGAVRIAVTDQGPGIPEDNLESIFERFYSERPAEGFGNHSGLGLSICRQIVEAHGGRIWAENIREAGAQPDARPRGARFVVELPVAPGAMSRGRAQL
ncbi:sensor N-terminal transmembrane domain-containing protein [Limibaculum sp. M0105]|uniref:histidine kinase n=1 Tax=Thermohalobaculum xanthum TaxID=2753746 RepID=A0A8J7M7L6_9RHOB|nr:stimulus-sensing domain-containing protein [Thermohalobaculum xanthum]MBK0400076.1 sensor N-terminal transmembrane domain-containing protein [Thermohalobaculum xanthum]